MGNNEPSVLDLIFTNEEKRAEKKFKKLLFF